MPAACQICTLVPGPELAELNALLADPEQWPKNILADWIIPKGALPGRIRQFGGVAVAKEWLTLHGFPSMTTGVVEHHFRSHVVHVTRGDEDMEQLGKMVTSKTDPGLALMPASRANLFIDYYALGIQLSVFALERMKADLAEMEANGDKIPPRTLWQLIELGAKLSMSQAALLSRGSKIEEQGDAMAGFRAGEAPLPSQKFGDHRIRTIEGKSRPVVDRGIADRRKYNKRAEQEGSPKFDA